MNIFKKSILLGGCVAALSLSAGNRAMAQGRPDFAQMRQERIDSFRDKLGIKDDSEWSAIEGKITKVMDAEREVMGMRMGNMFGRGRRGGGGGEGESQRQRRNPFGEPSPAMEDLQKALDANASSADIKAKLAAVRAETKEKEGKLEAAQEDLRSLLTPRQEAVAVVGGLLK